MIVLFSIFILIVQFSYSQEIKPNILPRILKDDPLNQYNIDNITNFDIVKALEILDVRIFKFHFGQFDKVYNLVFTIEESVDGKIVKIDTIYKKTNLYTYIARGYIEYYRDYLDQILIFTKAEENSSTMFIRLNSTSLQKHIKYVKTDPYQFFTWRRFEDIPWRLEKKIPLLVFASSWKDKKIEGLQLFCGVEILSENDPDTVELLSKSPHYFLLSYYVVERNKYNIQ